jgi:cytochrome c-type biogenesis protein CcmH/NrfG
MAGTLKIRIAWMVMLLALGGCAASPTQRLVKTVAQQQRAEQAYRGGHPEQALADYQALVRQLPQNADFWFRLGNVYVRLQRPDDAVDAYQHVLRIEPGHAKAWHNLGIVRLRQAEAAFAQGAQHAAGIDAGLQRDSAAMAHGIAALGGVAPDAPASSAPASSPAAAGRRP